MVSAQELTATSVLQAAPSDASTNAAVEFDSDVALWSSKASTANSGSALVEILKDGPTLGGWLGRLERRRSCTIPQSLCPICGMPCAETSDWVVRHTTCAVGGSVETIMATIGPPVARVGRHGQEAESAPAKSSAAPVSIAARELFETVVTEHYSELVAYARQKLLEPQVASCEAERGRGKRQLRTRFAAEECVSKLIDRLLETGTYARCATADEMVRYLMTGVENRIKNERRDQKVRRTREGARPLGGDDAACNGTNAEGASERDLHDYSWTKRDGSNTKAGLEYRHALRVDLERAFAAVTETAFDKPRPWLPSHIALALAEDVVGLSATAIVREILQTAGLNRGFRSMVERDLRGGIAEVRSRLQVELADSRPAKAVPFDARAARERFMRRWANDVQDEYRRALGRLRTRNNLSESAG
jgi:hypothetical protein